MHTIRTFIQNISDAAFRPQTYGKHLKEKTSTGLGYLYWLLVCSFTVTAIVLAGLYVPARVAIRAVVTESEPQLHALYPAGLVLTLNSGSLTTNSKKPTVIDPPFWVAMQKEKGSSVTHFLTIDVNAKVDDFAKYDSAVLVTKSYVVSKNDNQIRAFSLSEIHTNFKLDKKAYDGYVTAVMPSIHRVPMLVDTVVVIGLILLPFVGAGFSWAWHLLTLLGWSLLFWAVSGIMGKGLRYGQIFRLSLYGLTLPVLLSTFLGFLPGLFPLLSNVIFVLFMVMVLMKLPRPIMKEPKKASAPVKKAAKAPKKAAVSRKKTSRE